MSVENNKYPNNSRKAKEQASEEKRATPVVSGKVIQKKRGAGAKLADIFVPGDVTDVKEYIFADVFVPVVKETFETIVHLLLYGDPGGSGRKRGKGSRVSYASYYYGGRDHEDKDYRRIPRQQFDNVVFESRGEAERVLDFMYGILEEYQLVRVADLYELSGITDTSYTDVGYGWTDLSGACVVRERRGGYRIKLPRPMPID